MPSTRVARRSSRNKEISPSSQWYVLQVEPGTELDVASQVQGQFVTAGLASPMMVPSPAAKRSRRHANIPYRGLVFVCADDLEANQLKESGVLEQIEESDLCRGFIYEPETYLFEFEGLKAEDDSGSVHEAVTKINRLSRQLHFSGQAALLLSEAKPYNPGEKK
jgi:hypothetical protein